MGRRSDLYFHFRKLEMMVLERLGRSVAHRPGFAENRIEETNKVKMVLDPKEKVQSPSSKGDMQKVSN